LDLIVLGLRLAAFTPFLLPTQFITQPGVTARLGSFFRYFRSAISLIAGLFSFWGLRRITQVNHAPQPSGSFVQDQPCSFLGTEAVNYLKTFRIGLVACAGGTPRGILVMVRMGQRLPWVY